MWTLQIKFVQRRDHGMYECQVSGRITTGRGQNDGSILYAFAAVEINYRAFVFALVSPQCAPFSFNVVLRFSGFCFSFLLDDLIVKYKSSLEWFDLRQLPRPSGPLSLARGLPDWDCDWDRVGDIDRTDCLASQKRVTVSY